MEMLECTYRTGSSKIAAMDVWLEKAAAAAKQLGSYTEWMGWYCVDEHANEAKIAEIEKAATEIRENIDVFVLIGVGGSNQAARAVLKALCPQSGPEILYSGINLSPSHMLMTLEKIKNRNTSINVIAKNFATLEPGIAFRVLRQALEKQYGEEAAKHITATGSRNGDVLYTLSQQRGWRFFDFPANMGGRFSALSAVGLLPMAVGGVNIRELVMGASEMERFLKTTEPAHNPALRYAACRNAFQDSGATNEILTSFEYEFRYFLKWWVQLFGESEGKDGKGIFPSACSFSEDLHSTGQYIQQGKRILIETFLHVKNSAHHLMVEQEKNNADQFGYLDGKDLAAVNEADFNATLRAHADGGVPAIVIDIPEISARYFGQLFYFFEYACAVSGLMNGINPFDQPGVETYKQNLFQELKK